MINKNKFIEKKILRWLRRLHEEKRKSPNLAKDEFPTQIANVSFVWKHYFSLIICRTNSFSNFQVSQISVNLPLILRFKFNIISHDVYSRKLFLSPNNWVYLNKASP